MRWFALVVAASLMAACSSIDRFSDDLRERLLSRLQNAAPQANDEDHTLLLPDDRRRGLLRHCATWC